MNIMVKISYIIIVVSLNLLHVNYSSAGAVESSPSVSSIDGHIGETAENEVEGSHLLGARNGCDCHDYTCGCCSHVEEHKIHLNTTVCTNISYLNEDYGISFTVTWNSVTIYNETVSARNPPPYCVGAPYVVDLADVCIRLHDVDATRHKLHACVELEARLRHVRVSKYELGCFTIGHDNTPIVLLL